MSEAERRDALTVFEGVRPLLPPDALEAFIAEEGERGGLIIWHHDDYWVFQTGQYGDGWKLHVHTTRGQALLSLPYSDNVIVLREGWVMPWDEQATPPTGNLDDESS
jgi:hypothetical protein